MFHLKIEGKDHFVNTAYSSSESESALILDLEAAIDNDRVEEARSVLGKVAALHILRTLPSVIETSRVDLAIDGILEAYRALDASPSTIDTALRIAQGESFTDHVKDLLSRIKKWDDAAFGPVGDPVMEETISIDADDDESVAHSGAEDGDNEHAI
jgi:hypothetical protein